MSYLKLSFAKKKYIINATKFWTVLFVLLVILIADIVWLLTSAKALNIDTLVSAPTLVALISTLLILGIIILFVWIILQINKRLDVKMNEYLANYEYAHKGNDGEEQVYKSLIKCLNPSHYKIYPNFKIPEVRSDFDFVIVGPKGVILTEVKNYDTHSIFTYDKVFCKKVDGSIIKLRHDIREVIDWRAKKLERYFAELGFYDIKVHKILVFVNPESIEVQGDWKNKYKVFVIRGIPALEHYLLENYKNKEFTPELVSKICIALDVQVKSDSL